jgi:hypothetical protein
VATARDPDDGDEIRRTADPRSLTTRRAGPRGTRVWLDLDTSHDAAAIARAHQDEVSQASDDLETDDG